MNLSLDQLRDVAQTAGVADRAMSALAAAMMMEESQGDPAALGDYENGVPTSFGIGQVHQPTWPTIARATRGIMAAPYLPAYARAVAELKIALPILQDAARQALEAARTLHDRGYPMELANVLALTDAAWQGPGVRQWAARTQTGDPAEIREDTAPGRTGKILEHLAHFGIGTGRAKWSWVLPVALVGVGGLALWGLSEAMERR